MEAQWYQVNHPSIWAYLLSAWRYNQEKQTGISGYSAQRKHSLLFKTSTLFDTLKQSSFNISHMRLTFTLVTCCSFLFVKSLVIPKYQPPSFLLGADNRQSKNFENGEIRSYSFEGSISKCQSWPVLAKQPFFFFFFF